MARKPFVWIGRALLATLGLLLLLLISLLIFRPTLNLELLRPQIEVGLTAQSGLAVTIRDLRLRTSLWPTVFARDVHLVTADPTGSTDIAKITDLEFQIALLPLLRQRFSFDKIRLEGVELHVQPALRLFDRSSVEAPTEAGWKIVGIRDLEGVDIVVEYDTAEGDSHKLDLDSLHGGVSQTDPFKLEVVGTLSEIPLGLDLGGPPVEDLLGLPEVVPLTARLRFGELSAYTHVSLSSARILLSDIDGELRSSPFSGELEMDFTVNLPAFAGEFALDHLDVGKWIPKTPQSGVDEQEHDMWGEIAQQPLPFDVLGLFNAELDLSIGRVDGAPVTIDNFSTGLRIENGQLSLSTESDVAGAPVVVLAGVSSEAQPPQLDLDLRVTGLHLEHLIEIAPQLSEVQGEIGLVSIAATAQGETPSELLHQARVELEASQAQLSFAIAETARHLEISISEMNSVRNPDATRALETVVAGHLQGQAFRAQISSGDLEDLISDQTWPIRASVHGLGAEAQIDATVTSPISNPSIDAEFSADGTRLGDLEPWLGLPNDTDLPFRIAGRAQISSTRRSVVIDDGRLGQTTMRAELVHNLGINEHLDAAVDVDAVDPSEFKELFNSAAERTIEDSVLRLDIPLLPDKLTFPDAQIDFRVARWIRKPADLTEIAAQLSFTDGVLEPSPFGLQAADTTISGRLALGWSDSSPHIDVEIEATEVDLANLVDLDTIVEGQTGTVDHLQVSIQATGSTLRELLSKKTNVQGVARGVSFHIPTNEEHPIRLELDSSKIEGLVDQPLQIDGTGRVQNIPLSFNLTADIHELDDVSADELLLRVSARLADIEIEAAGGFDLPLDYRHLDLDYTITADSLVLIDDIEPVGLPDYGPLHVEGHLISSPTQFQATFTKSTLGETQLEGDLEIDWVDERPSIDARIKSSHLRLDDLLPRREPESEASNADEGVTDGETAEDSGEETFLDRIDTELLKSFDARLSLLVDEIAWGDHLGPGGELSVTLDNGRFVLGPFESRQAEASVGGTVEFVIDDSTVTGGLDLHIDNFNYGPIVRYLEPEAEGDGHLSLITSLRSSGSSLDQLLTQADGYVDFTLYPANVDTSFLDLWAAGLYSTVLGVFNPDKESVLNCITGQFSLGEGLMVADGSWLDTSAIRVRGKGSLDLGERTIDLKLRPRPKRRTFLNLATPVGISGTWDDPSIGIAAGGLAGTAFRIYTWAVTVFFEVFRSPLPADGSDICVAPVPRGQAEPED